MNAMPDPRRRARAAFAVLAATVLGLGVLASCGGDERPAAVDAGARPARDVGARVSAGAARDAYDRARAAGKPLLAVLVPTTERLRWLHGCIAGSLVPRTDVLPALALAHVECLSPIDVEALAPGTTGSRLPLAVVVETDGEGRPPSAILLPETVEPDVLVGSLDGSWQILARGLAWFHASSEQEAFLRVDRPPLDPASKDLLDAPRRLLMGDDALLRRRAAAARTALGDATADALEASVRAGLALAPESADRGAAVVLVEARSSRAGELAERRVLVGARRRLVDEAPRGSRWAREAPLPPTDESLAPAGDFMLPDAGSGHPPDWCGTGRMREASSSGEDLPAFPPFLQFVGPVDAKSSVR